MKTKTRILSLILCLAMVIGYFTFGVSAAETTVEFKPEDLGLANAAEFTSETIGEITFSAAKNSGGTKPAYYESGTQVRLYAKNSFTITPASGYKILSIVITVNTEKDTVSTSTGTIGNAICTVDGGDSTLIPTDGTQPVVLTKGDSGQWRIEKIIVKYCDVNDVVEECTHSDGEKLTVEYDETDHWTRCAACGKIVEGTTEAHSVDANGDCSGCDYHKDPSEPEEPATESTFVKVTEAPADWSGTYLIVYEVESVIFDGSLTVLDAANNNKTVIITDGKIEISKDYAFTISKIDGGYTIQSNSGYYIGQTSNANGLKSSTGTTYTNALSLNDDGSVNVVGSGGAYLRFNTSSGDDRFRYYKSSSYTGQKAITLYKLESESAEKFTVEKTNMRFGSDLSLLFAFKQSDIADLSAVKAKIVQSTDSGSETVYVNGSGWTTTTIDEVDYYVVEYSGIAGKEMSDEVTIVVEDAEGNELSTSFTTSIRTYAMARLENTTDAEFKCALVDMLNYGAAAQTYFENYNAENPANALLTPAQEELASAEGTYEDKRSISDENVVKASNLRFASKISMLFSLDATCQNTYAVFTWTDHKGADHEVRVETYSALGDGSLVVELTGLVVADARQMVTCKIYDQNNNEVAVVTDSVESYVARCSEDTEDLAVAFMKFADSAYAYLH